MTQPETPETSQAPEAPQPQVKKLSPKTLAIFIGIWLIGIIGLFGGSIVYNNYQAKQYVSTAIPYLHQVIPELSKWDPEVVKGLMTPETLDKIPEDKLQTLMKWFSRLGKLLKIEEAEFEKKDARTLDTSEQQTIVEYTVPLQYENGSASLNIKLLAKDDTFTVYHFSFSSERLAVNPPQK